MTFDASDRTLGLVNIWQVLRKMYWEIELIKAIPEKVRVGANPVNPLQVQDAALYATANAASTGFALVDWLYHSVHEDPILAARTSDAIGDVDFVSTKRFRKSMRSLNKSINACHQICNANKHFHLSDSDGQFKVMTGEIVMEHPDGAIDISTIAHIMQNGDTTDGNTSVFEMLVDLAAWWEGVLTNVQLPGRDKCFPQGAP